MLLPPLGSIYASALVRAAAYKGGAANVLTGIGAHGPSAINGYSNTLLECRFGRKCALSINCCYYVESNAHFLGAKMPLGQRFDPAKAIEAILYVARRVDDPSFHRISKICYFADKYKLAKSGGLVIADEYVAMKHGPVPSRLYDILKAARGRVGPDFDVNGNHHVTPKRDADMSYFSEEDVESLDAAIRKCARLSFGALTEMSHDAAWIAAGENDLMSLEEIARATTRPDIALASVRDRFSMPS